MKNNGIFLVLNNYVDKKNMYFARNFKIEFKVPREFLIQD